MKIIGFVLALTLLSACMSGGSVSVGIDYSNHGHAVGHNHYNNNHLYSYNSPHNYNSHARTGYADAFWVSH